MWLALSKRSGENLKNNVYRSDQNVGEAFDFFFKFIKANERERRFTHYQKLCTVYPQWGSTQKWALSN